MCKIDNLEKIKDKTGMTDAEIQNLIDAYYTLDDIERDLRPLNEEYPGEEYERVSKACYYLQEYMLKDLKVDMRAHAFHPSRSVYSGRSMWGKPELVERANSCTEQLHNLMDAFYQFLHRNKINTTELENYLVQDYWRITCQYQRSILLYREAEIIECEQFITSMKKRLDWMLEDEPRAVIYSDGFKRRPRR